MLACEFENPVFFRRFALLMTAYVIAVIAVAFAFRFNVVPQALRVPVALLPAVPAAFLPFVILERLRSLDELQRKIQLEALAFAAGMTAVVTLSYGFLQQFAKFPDVNLVWVWPLLGFLWGAGVLAGRRRYA